MWSLCLSAFADPVTVAVDLEWRAMALGGHASHGPGFGFGVGLLRDHLRVGLSGFARPGPLNPVTFPLEVDPAYRGQSTLALRSDGGLGGLYVAPGFAASDRVRIDLPAMVGYGGFGFYLHGDDRDTPDGARTSVWEDRLMDGRDSAFGVGVDVGPRVAWSASPAAQPWVAVRYTTIVGYDAYLRDDYGGLSVALGLSVGRL